MPDGEYFRFFVELDNRSERIRSAKDTVNWERKIRIYEAVQDLAEKRFRVLVVTTKESERLTRILETACALARNPDRSLFYGIALPDYLKEQKPLIAECFRDHRRDSVGLVPAPHQPVKKRRICPLPSWKPVVKPQKHYQTRGVVTTCA